MPEDTTAPSPQVATGSKRRSLVTEVGVRFGRGVVIEIDLKIPRPGRPPGSGQRAARPRCDCGTEYITALQSLFNGGCQSCGCLWRERQRAAVTKHGMNRHPLFKTWEGMVSRCRNPDDAYYYCYGGRGISVCEQWLNPRVFLWEIESLLGPRPKGYSLDRMDNDGNYEPGNVQWASASTQARNRRRRAPGPPPGPEHVRAPRKEPVPILPRICEHCDKEYTPKRNLPGLRFCSKVCTAAARRAAGTDDVELTCHMCGGSFTASKYDRIRHCSKSCAATCQHAGNCPAQ